MPTLEPINAVSYRIKIGRDQVELGDRNAAQVKGFMKYIRNRGTYFILSKAGTPTGLPTVNIQEGKVRIPYGAETIELTAHDPDNDFPDGRAEFNVILNSKPTPDGNGDYWQVLDFTVSGFNMGKVLGLDEEYDQARCIEEWGEDYGTGTYIITPTEIKSPDGLSTLKTKYEHIVHSLEGVAINANHDTSKIGTNVNNGQDITYTGVSRDHLNLPRRLLIDANNNTARIEDIKIDGNQIKFKLPKSFIDSATYPVQHATGADPAYTQDMDSFLSTAFSADATWSDYDIYTNKSVAKGSVAEIIMANTTTGTENTMGLRTRIPRTASYGNVIQAIWGDDTNIYVGGATTNTVRKYLKSDLSYIGETATYSGNIYAIWGDSTHVYAGGVTTNTVRKYLKSDLSYIGETASYGGTIYAIWGDSTHIYVGGTTTNKVRKYLKSDLSYIGETASYGSFIRTVWGDDTHIYVGGANTETVRKYLKSDLSYIGQTASYGGTINAIWGDSTHVYAGGAATFPATVRKYLKSDLSYIGETATYGNTIYALCGDSTYVYAGGYSTNTVRKYLKSDLSYIGETASYGGTIYAIWSDSTYVCVGGDTVYTVWKFRLVSLFDMTTSRYVTIHEAEAGGQTHCRMFVLAGDDGYIQGYHSDISDADYFYIVGYWSNVTFTEAWDINSVLHNNTWEQLSAALSNGASLVHQLIIRNGLDNLGQNIAATIGVRAVGSSLERKLLVHESEADGSNLLDLLVKADSSRQVEGYMTFGTTQPAFYDAGYFGSELDFVEKWVETNASATWQNWGLTAYLDQNGRHCDFILAHKNEANTCVLGIRDGDDSSTDRKLTEHEAESAGSGNEFTGFGISAKSDSDGHVQVYLGLTITAYGYFTGYFKPGKLQPRIISNTLRLLTTPRKTEKFNRRVTSNLRLLETPTRREKLKRFASDTVRLILNLRYKKTQVKLISDTLRLLTTSRKKEVFIRRITDNIRLLTTPRKVEKFIRIIGNKLSNQLIEDDYGELSSTTQSRWAEKFYSFPKSTIYEFSIRLTKLNSADGIGYCRVRKVSDDSIIGTLGSIDLSTITSEPTYTWYTFNNKVVNDNIQDIYITFEAAPTTPKTIRIKFSSGNTYSDGNLSYYISSWTQLTSNDLSWKNLIYSTESMGLLETPRKVQRFIKSVSDTIRLILDLKSKKTLIRLINELIRIGSYFSDIFTNENAWGEENYGTTPISSIESGEYSFTGATVADEPISYIKGFSKSNYIAEAKIKAVGTADGAAFLCPRFDTVNNKYEVAVDFEYSSISLNKVVGGSWSAIDSIYMSALAPLTADTWYTLKVDCRIEGSTTRLICYCNGIEYINKTDNSLQDKKGFAILTYDTADTYHIHFDDVKVYPIELVSSKDITRIVSVFLNLLTNSTKAENFVRRIAETIKLEDTQRKVQKFVRRIAENVNLIKDNVFRRLFVRIPTVDTLRLIDTAVIRGTLRRLVSDTERIIELSQRRVNISRLISDTIQILENMVKWPSIFKKLYFANEFVRIPDTVRSVAKYLRYINETERVVENVLKSIKLLKFASETLRLIESTTLARRLVKRIAENEFINEVAQRTFILRIFAADTVRLIEQTRNVMSLRRVVNLQERVIETVSKRGTFRRIANETLNITESFSSARKLIRRITSNETIAEQTSRLERLIRRTAANVNLVENITKRVNWKRLVTDNLYLLETIRTSRNLRRLISENENITWQIRRVLNLRRIITDNINILTTKQPRKFLLKLITENEFLTETLRSTRGLVRRFTDNVNIVEVINRARKLSRITNETVRVIEGIVKLTSGKIFKFVNENLYLKENLTLARRLIRRLTENELIATTRNTAFDFVRFSLDTVRVLEQSLRPLSLRRIVNLQERIIENISRRKILNRLVNETFNIIESIRKDFVKSISENERIVESTKLIKRIIRLATDTLRIIDTLSRTFILRRYISDTLRIIDSITKRENIVRRIIDYENILDTSIRSFDFIRRITSAETITENSSRLRTFIKRISDNVNILESIKSSRKLARRINEQMYLTEYPSLSFKWIKIISEQIRILTSAIGRLPAFIKTINEFVNIYLPRDYIVIEDRAVDIQDLYIKHHGFVRLFSEDIQILETIVRWPFISHLFKFISDNINLIEVTKPARKLIRRISDNELITEQVNRLGNLIRRFNETENILEFVIKRTNWVRRISENIYLLESNLYRKRISRIITDTERIIEIIRSSIRFYRIVVETERLLENISKRVRLMRRIADIVNITEVIRSRRNLRRIIADTITIIENNLFRKRILRIVAETERILETIQRRFRLYRIILETERIIETINKSVSFRRVVIETERIIENITKPIKGLLIRVASELENITENIYRPARFLRVANEFIRLVDIDTFRKFRNLIITDVVRIQEFILKRGKLFRSVLDTVRIIEYRSIANRFVRRINETVLITESFYAAVSGKFIKFANEVIKITENRIKSFFLTRAIFEAEFLLSSFNRSIRFSRIIVEPESIIEVPNILRNIFKWVSDNVNVLEASTYVWALRLLKYFANELVAITDTSILAGRLTRLVAENIYVQETINRTGLLIRAIINEVELIIESIYRLTPLQRIVNETVLILTTANSRLSLYTALIFGYIDTNIINQFADNNIFKIIDKNIKRFTDTNIYKFIDKNLLYRFTDKERSE